MFLKATQNSPKRTIFKEKFNLFARSGLRLSWGTFVAGPLTLRAVLRNTPAHAIVHAREGGWRQIKQFPAPTCRRVRRMTLHQRASATYVQYAHVSREHFDSFFHKEMELSFM